MGAISPVTVLPTGAAVNEEIRRRDAILAAVRVATDRFLAAAAPWQDNIVEVLQRLGEASRVSRGYLFEN